MSEPTTVSEFLQQHTTPQEVTPWCAATLVGLLKRLLLEYTVGDSIGDSLGEIHAELQRAGIDVDTLTDQARQLARATNYGIVKAAAVSRREAPWPLYRPGIAEVQLQGGGTAYVKL